MTVLRVLIRWLLVPASAVAVVIALVAGGRWAVGLADARCPAELMVGGACVAPWHTTVVEASIYTGLVLAAIGLVLIPALIAPRGKRIIAILGFMLATGIAVAAYLLTGWTDLAAPAAAVAVAGAAGLWSVWSWRRETHAP